MYREGMGQRQAVSGGSAEAVRNVRTEAGMNFFLEIIPPTVTAQMRRVTVRSGKPMFYKSRALKDAKALFVGELMMHQPEQPLEGPVLLNVLWSFPTKTHKEGSFRVTRPDTDNLQKLLKDCMTEVGFWKDDAQVCIEVITKRWTREKPGILISVESLENCPLGIYP